MLIVAFEYLACRILRVFPGGGAAWLFGLAVLTGAVAVPCVAPSAVSEAPPFAIEDPSETGARLVHFIWKRHAADEALRMGFPSLAMDLYREAEDLLPEGDVRRPRLTIDRSNALLALGRFSDAGVLLDSYRGEVNDTLLLRRAMLSWHGRRWEEFRYRLQEITQSALTGEDRAWYAFLFGALREVEGDTEEANRLYRQAEAAAVSAAQRSEFTLVRFRTLLLRDEPTEETLERLRNEMEAHDGTVTVFRFAQKSVLVLEALDRTDEAIDEAARWRARVPVMERELRDRFLLLEGLVAGPEHSRGRAAFEELLITGVTRNLQRAALYQLGRDLPEGDEREFFENLLAELIDGEVQHSLIDELLIFRSRIHFAARRFEEATEDAETVLSQYPGSRLRRDALRLLGHIAWEEEKYRTAADYVNRLRDEIPEGTSRSELGVLVADCYFRAEDYENAADAYGIVLREGAETLSPGLLLFQRVIAELRAGRMDRVRAHLDEVRFQNLEDLDYLWQAEWNLLREMQQRGRMEEAYGRVSELIDRGDDYRLPQALRIRFLWLRAQLAFESGRSDETLPLLDVVLSELDRQSVGAELSAELVRSIRGYTRLLRAQALLDRQQAEEAVAILRRLREENSGDEPAIYSYLVEARYHASTGQTVEAERLLTALADSYPESPYAPIALYEAAVNTGRGGLDEGYEERAIGRLERLIETYPDHELVFHARLKQADLLRAMNRFGTARQIYESLENRYPDHPEWFRVKVSLADTFLAQGETTDESFLERAVVTLERLYDLPQLTADMRAEAGFKYGFAHEKLENREEAREIYWLVIAAVFEDDNSESLGSKGRYWASRSVFHLARLLEEGERWNEAREAYSLIFHHRLPGESLARSRLTPLTTR